jgi:DNA-binding IclR family transcriptional regulator
MTPHQSVTRAFTVVEYLAGQDGWVGIRKMARELNLGPSTVSRLLSSLKDLGYVTQRSDDGSYMLGLKVAWLAAQALDHVQLRSVAHPHMVRLTTLVNETAHLAVLERHEMIYIEKVDSHQAMQMRSRIGGRAHTHSTAVGRAMLAFLPLTESAKLLSCLTLTSETAKTITDAHELQAYLALVRQQGFAVDDEDNELGIRCIGSPIFDHNARVAAALSISGWTVTMTYDRLPELARELRATCSAISAELGYHHMGCPATGECTGNRWELGVRHE